MSYEVYADFCRNLTTSTGSGDITLGVAVSGYSDIVSSLASGDTLTYSLFTVDSYGSPNGQWETGAGQVVGSTLTRNKIFATSSGGSEPVPIDLSAGNKHVLLTVPARVVRSSNPMECRLSLSSSVPVTTSDTTGGTLYLHQFGGNRVTLWNGYSFERWSIPAAGYLSLALSGTSSGVNYDVYLYKYQGALYLGLNAGWASDTARTDFIVYYTPTSKCGLLVNDSSFTEVVSGRNIDSNSATYLGTIRTSAANTVADTDAQRYLWNYYNRRPRRLTRTESTSSWTYSTAAWRYYNGSSSNLVRFVVGMPGEAWLTGSFPGAGYSGGGSASVVGVGVDSSSSPTFYVQLGGGAVAYRNNGVVIVDWPATIGYHYASMMEFGHASTITFYGSYMTLRLEG